MPNDLIYPNGIDALTGEPLLPAKPAELVNAAVAVLKAALNQEKH